MPEERSFMDPRRPVTPTLIPILFWLGVIVCVIVTVINFVIYAMLSARVGRTDMPFVLSHVGFALILRGVGVLTIGPLVWYVFCEALATFFHMSRNLEEIAKHGKETGPRRHEPENR